MAGRTSIRLKILRSSTQRLHRYTVLRAIAQTFSLAVLVVVPLTGLARVDFFRGEHHLFFEAAPLKHALAGVIVGIAAMYVVTFLSNVVAGRLFCGWGCPVGQVSRFGDLTQTPGLSLSQRLRTHLVGGLFSVVFVVSVMAWWVDLRILVASEPTPLAIGWGLVLVGVAGAYLHGRFWRWSFCKSACPIGLYYSIVAPAQYFGVHFRNQDQTCIDCHACDRVCPVDLDPRNLAELLPDRQGLAVADAPGFNHCLECGDCVRACDDMMIRTARGRTPDVAPLHLGYFAGPQRLDPRDEPAAPSTTADPTDPDIEVATDAPADTHESQAPVESPSADGEKSRLTTSATSA